MYSCVIFSTAQCLLYRGRAEERKVHGASMSMSTCWYFPVYLHYKIFSHSLTLSFSFLDSPGFAVKSSSHCCSHGKLLLFNLKTNFRHSCSSYGYLPKQITNKNYCTSMCVCVWIYEKYIISEYPNWFQKTSSFFRVSKWLICERKIMRWVFG